MKLQKRLICALVCLCLLAFAPWADGAAQALDITLEPDYLSIRDESMNYWAYSTFFGNACELSGSDTPAAMDYTVPAGGVTALIFFQGDGGCTRSNTLLESITDADWAKNPKVNLVAVESTRCDKQSVERYIAQKDVNHVLDQVYYSELGCVGMWYAQLLQRGGDMEDVNSLSGSLSFAHVLLITGESDGNYIRFSLPGSDTAAYLAPYVKGLLGETDVGHIDSKVTVTVPGTAHYDYLDEILQSVNQTRAAHGAADVRLSAELTKLAMQRAAECALYYSHTRPDRSDCFSVTAAGAAYAGELKGENIAAGYTTAEDVMKGWINSPGHLANIVSTGSDRIGIGCFENNGSFYWVQLFGAGGDTAPTATAAEPADVQVRTVISRLKDLRLSTNAPLAVAEGETVAAPTLLITNAGYDTGRGGTLLVPAVDIAAPGANRQLAAAAAETGTGEIRLTGLAAGTGKVYLCAYAGQSDAPGVQLCVDAPESGMTAVWKYDYNRNRAVDSADILAMRKLMANVTVPTGEEKTFLLLLFDQNGNSVVDSADILCARKMMASVDPMSRQSVPTPLMPYFPES